MNAATQKRAEMPVYRFDFNLASRDYRWMKAIRVGLWAAVALGLIVIAVEIQSYSTHRQDIGRLQRSINRLQADQTRLRSKLSERGLNNVGPQTTDALSKQVAFSNSLISQKAFSWTILLSDLEDVVPSNVSLVSILPSAKSQSVNLTGTALTLNDLTRLMNRFEASSTFSDALLTDQKDTPSARVTFSMTVRYLPGNS